MKCLIKQKCSAKFSITENNVSFNILIKNYFYDMTVFILTK